MICLCVLWGLRLVTVVVQYLCVLLLPLTHIAFCCVLFSLFFVIAVLVYIVFCNFCNLLLCFVTFCLSGFSRNKTSNRILDSCYKIQTHCFIVSVISCINMVTSCFAAKFRWQHRFCLYAFVSLSDGCSQVGKPIVLGLLGGCFNCILWHSVKGA